MAEVRVDQVVKRFGPVEVLRGVTLTVQAHSLVTLLGPSGCGKTTLLRLVAGLERPQGGRLLIGGRTVSDPTREVHVPAAERRVGMVFQSYALWPHKTVWENVAFPLQVRRVPAGEARDRVRRALELVQLEPLGDRLPGELSGGQQQRVALARAIVYEPDVLLLDEPLSNLDAKLRAEMRYEIRELQQRSRLTTIYVTHDQEEAFVISDRICLMNAGRIEQEGMAVDLYEHPRSAFVADFVGAANRLLGTAEAGGDNVSVRVRLADGLALTVATQRPVAAGERVGALVRLEDVVLGTPGSTGVPATVVQVTYLGGMTEYAVATGALRLRARVPGAPRYRVGECVALGLARGVALPERDGT